MKNLISYDSLCLIPTLNDALLRLKDSDSTGITIIRGISNEEFVSYKELFAKACYTLHNFQINGVREGDEVMIQIEDSKEFLVVFWACLLGKFIAVPLSLGSQSEQKNKVFKVLTFLDNPYLVCSEEHFTRLEKTADEGGENEKNLFAYINKRYFSINQALQERHEGLIVAVKPTDIAYIQFSSGSTGMPKGVVLTHENLMANATSIIERSGIEVNDSTLSWMPLTHDMGLICFHFSSLVSGINQFIMPTSLFIRTPILWIEKANEHRVNYLYSPNFGLQYFLSALNNQEKSTWNLSAIKCIYNGAEPISVKVCSAFTDELSKYGLDRNAIFPGYGLAEASVAVTLPDPKSSLKSYIINRKSLNIGNQIEFLSDTTSENAVSFVEVGYQIEQTFLRISDWNDKVLADGFVGNIQIKGKNVTSGYYNFKEATDKLLTSDGWVRTGDLGFLQAGKLVITGRAKEVIISSGQNYYPHDIESIAQKIDGIELGKVVASSLWNESLNREEVLLFVWNKQKMSGFVNLINPLKNIIANEIGLTIDKVIPTRKIFKTTSGKIQRFQFIEAYLNGEYDSDLQEIDQLLVADDNNSDFERFWKNETGKAFVGEKTIYELELNSLKIMQLVNKINARFGSNISVQEILRAENLSSLKDSIVNAEINNQVSIIQKAPNQSYYPLTAAQQRLWMLHKKQATSAYNISVGYEVEQLIDAELLEKAILKSIERHEILRTAFVEKSGEVFQSVKSYEETVFNLQIINETDATRINQIIEEEANTYFNLESGNLIRGLVIQVEENKSLFLLTIHHLIADGWSMGVLLNEISQFYASKSLRSSKSLNIQYKDYSNWLQQQPFNEASLDFWKEKLAGELPVLSFPTNGQRRAVRSNKANTLHFNLSKNTTESLKEFSKTHNVTPFIAMLSLVKLALYRYTEQEDIIIGTDNANRQMPEIQPLIGYFLNTICIRTKFDANDSFESFLKTIKTQVLEAFEHQDTSFEQILDELKPNFDASHSPIFDVLVVYQNFDEAEFLSTNQAKLFEPAINETIVDLHFEISESIDGLKITLRYNADLYEENLMTDFGQHFKQLSAAVLACPSLPLYEYDFLLDSERNITDSYERLHNFQPEEQHIIQLIEDSVTKHSTRIALNDKTTVWSYSQLWEVVSNIASNLSIETEEPVGIMMPRSVWAIASMLGILKAGGAYVPLDLDLPTERLKFIIANASICKILTIGNTVDDFSREGIELINVEKLEAKAIKNNEISTNQLAYILYTSGSTGTPKGVEIEHYSLVDYATTFGEYFGIVANDSVIQQSSLSFDTSIEEIFPALLAGAEIRIIKLGGKDIDSIVKEAENGATILSTTPLVIEQLNQEDRFINSGIHTIISGGDTLSYSQIDRIVEHKRVVNTYGPTESTVCVTYGEVSKDSAKITIGKPIRNRLVKIVNRVGKIQPIGVFGELIIGGSGLARGYRNNPFQTENQFFIDNETNERYYRSGDFGRWTTSGEIEFLGRKDAQLKIRGYRVEIDDIEKNLQALDGVKSVAVIAKELSTSPYLVAFYTGNISEKELRLSISKKLPFYMIPQYMVCISEMPVTITGKIDRIYLQSQPISIEIGQNTEILSSFEQSVAKIWQEVIGIKRNILLSDNFFELGGNSIKAIKILQLISAKLHIKAEISDLFQYSSLADFTEKISQNIHLTETPILSIGNQANYELSSAQNRMWLLNELYPNSAAYNIAFACDIKGILDEEIFEDAWLNVICRHESLRTIFIKNESQPCQVILPMKDVNFQVKWFDTIEQEVEDCIWSMAHQCFDLSKAPLIAVNMYCLGNNRHILSVVIHHIIADDWSVGKILNEVFTYYNNITDSKECILPVLPIQYKDYATWQKEILRTGLLQKQATYWQKQLEGEIPKVELPLDYARSATKNHIGDSVSMTIDEGLTKQLSSFAQQHSMSEYMLWLASLNILLYKYTNQNDFIVGCPVAGRQHADLENQIGFFVNTLPIRTQFEGNWNTHKLLQYTKQMVSEALSNQDYPFDELINTLELERDLSRGTLFDVMLTMQNTSSELENLSIHDVAIKKHNTRLSFNKFDWDFEVRPYQNKRIITINFDKSLFKMDKMQSVLKHFINIMKNITTHNQPIEQICMLSQNETEQLLAWSEGQREGFKSEATIIDLLTNAINNYGHKKAISDAEHSLTYAQIGDVSGHIAGQLLAASIDTEECVGVFMPRSVYTLTSVLGIMKAGGAYVPLDVNYPIDRLKYIIDNAQINIVLVEKTGDSKRLGIPHLKEVVINQNFEGQYSLPVVEAKHLAYVLYTSGSTGNPKGVEIEHRNTVAFLEWCVDEFKNTNFDESLAVTSLNFDLSVFEFFFPVLVGKPIHVLESGLDLVDYLPVNQSKKYLLNTVPSVIETLLKSEVDLSSVQVLNMAGEPIGKYVYERLDYQNTEVRNLYGPTEDTTYSTGFYIKDATTARKIGQSKKYSQAYILSVGNQLSPVGVPGEICLSGAGLARGYRFNEALTSEKFTSHFLYQDQKMYRTGDLGYWDTDGNITCIGRLDNQVKLRGYRIELSEIEKKIESFVGVLQAFVIVVGVETQKQLVAFYESENDLDSALKSYLHSSLPIWMIPDLLIKTDVFPQTPNGKVDRKKLHKLIPNSQENKNNIEELSPVEAIVKEIWQGVLSLSDVSIHDNFFRLGGNSLKATQIIARLRKQWSEEIPLRLLFLYPTICQLAEALADFTQHSATIDTEWLVPTKEKEFYPLSTAQKRVWFAHEISEQTNVYNMPFRTEIVGNLDTAAFAEAWNEFIKRHDSARTTFVLNEGEPFQKTLNFDEMTNIYEFSESQSDNLEEVINEFLLRPFNLLTDNLVRVKVWKQHNKATLGVVLHHIIADGWSLGVLMNEVMNAYNQKLLSIQPVSLSAPKIQYKDFVVWEAKFRKSAQWQKSRRYWLELFEGELPTLDLVANHKRVNARKSTAAKHTEQLNLQLSDTIKQVANKANATNYHFFLASFNAFLYRFTNQSDIVIGCAAAGRETPLLENQVGLYVNTLPIRTKIGNNLTFDELLSETQYHVTEAYSNQVFGFDELLSEIGLVHQLNRSPIFDIMFTIEDTAWSFDTFKNKIAGLTFINTEILQTKPKYDLEISIAELNGVFTVSVSYDADLFEQNFVHNFFGSYNNFIRKAVENPTQKITAIDYITESEQQKLFEWGNINETQNTQSNLIELFKRQVEATPDKIAVRDEHNALSYRELDVLSTKLANSLTSKYCTTNEERIGIYLQRDIFTIISIVGILKAGAVYVPIDTDLPESRAKYMIEDSSITYLIVDNTTQQNTINFNIEVLNIKEVLESSINQEESSYCFKTNQLAYIMYTSGTTGNPKGVMIEHDGIIRLVKDPNYVTLDEKSRLLMTGAISFDATTFEIWGILLNGGELGITSKETLLDTQLLKNKIVDWNINIMWMTASWFNQVVDEDISVFQPLYYLLVGGDRLSPAHINQLRSELSSIHIINGYGPTENTTFSLCHQIEDSYDANVPIGKPISGSGVLILDKNLKLVPTGAKGEIYVGGRGLARGYQNNEKLTAEKFIQNPFDSNKLLYRTGDFGRWNLDGTVSFEGRMDEQVKIRGFRIEVSEIENTISKIEGIKQVAVIVKQRANGEKFLVAFYVCDGSLNELTIKAFLRQSLPIYCLPEQFMELPQLPLNTNGKTDTKALQTIEIKNSALIFEMPTNEIETKISSIWQALLDKSQIGINENFFEIGGHSLSATKLVSQISKELGVSLSVSKVFQKPTIHDLALEVEAISLVASQENDVENLIEEFVL